MLTITDEITGETTTVDKYDTVGDRLRPWYPEAPAEVYGAIDDLDNAIARGEPTGALEAYLAIRIERS